MSENLPDNRPGASVPAYANGSANGVDPSRYGSVYSSGAEVEQSGVRDFIGVLRRRRWLVAVLTIACVGAAAWRMSQEVPEYRATSMFRLVNARGAVGGSVVDAGPGEVGRGVDVIQSEILLLRNATVLAAAADYGKLRLRTLTKGFSLDLIGEVDGYEVPGAPRTGADTLRLTFTDQQVQARLAGRQARADYGEPLDLPGIRFTVTERPDLESATLVVVPRGAAITQITSGLRARAVTGTDGISLEYTSDDPDFAVRVVNSMALIFQSWRTGTAKEQARLRRTFLEEQVESTDSLLVQAQLQLSRYRYGQGIVRSEQQVTAQQSEQLQLELRRGELEADRRLYIALLNELRQPRQGNRTGAIEALVSAPGIMSNPAVMQFFQQLSQYERERAELTAGEWRRSDSHPDIQRLDNLIVQTEVRLATAVQGQISSLQARIASIDEMKARRAGDRQGLPDVEAEEFRLAQQVQTLQQVGDQLRAEYQRARITEAVEAGPVEVLQLASNATRVMGGQVRTLMVGLMIGLLLGGGAAVGLERMNTSIRRREEIHSILRVPELAVIPPIVNSAKEKLRLGLPYSRKGKRKPYVARRNGNGHADAEDDAAGEHPRLSLRELVTASPVPSLGAEAYRTLRTNLIFSQAVQSLKTVVITSSLKGEGKTTTACNLAITVAQQGRRVLLVDCDLRRPSVHKLFWLTPEPGLSEVLQGASPVDECIRSTAVEGLSVLPVGTLPSGPSELLGSPRMASLLEAFTAEYDMVILDTPPVLAVPDASILATQADGVVVVVRAGRTDRAAAQQAMHRLLALGANVLGAVLNDPDVQVVNAGGYYDYYYYSAEYV